ncbi:MAG: transporter permease [Rhodospirillales bacterium]|nr:transporter permease [Rhodospirillales bacterium]
MDSAVLDFLAATIRIATPLMLAAMGGIISERAGVFAVGLEGMMLAGAFGAAAGTFLTGSTAIGIASSIGCGALVGLTVAVVAVRFRADQMVTGLAANALVAGLTSFLLRGVIGHGRTPVIHTALLDPWPVPGLSAIPVIGSLLFQQPPLTYLAFTATVPLYWFLVNSHAGLLLRAAGENPAAAYSVGANPAKIRTVATIAGAAITGLGGAVLVLQQVGTFSDGMTGGRGFLALAAIIVGRWMPFGTMAACLVFGAAEAMHLWVQVLGLPVSSYIVQMLPYLLALAVLAAWGRSVVMPAAIGVAYGDPDRS